MSQNKEIRLNLVMAGIGNQMHNQVHRSFKLSFQPEVLNQAYNEKVTGGITGGTIHALGLSGGMVNSQHSGLVDIEDGWQTRRGLMMLRMTLIENARESLEMTVLGYLAGGGFAGLGVIPDDVMFVPVRSYMLKAQSDLDSNMRTVTRSAMVESSQFLLNDPKLLQDLVSIRPIDLVGYAFGEQDTAERDPDSQFAGVSNSHMADTGINLSRSINLDVSANGIALAGYSSRVARGVKNHNTLGQNMATNMGGLVEQENYTHPFLELMRSATNGQGYRGFVGWSLGELRRVFQGFDNAIPRDGLHIGSKKEDKNYLSTTPVLGSAEWWETIFNEIGFLTVHGLLDVGLTSLDFTASNNTSRSRTSEGGLHFSHGIPVSIYSNDSRMADRAQDFKHYLFNGFFEKYAPGKFGIGRPIEMRVKAHCLGETEVSLVLDGNEMDVKTSIQSSATINRTSPNITNSLHQKNAGEGYLENVKEWFAD